MTGAGALPGSGRFPNATQLEFLRACLLESEPGRVAFERWLDAVGDPIAGLRDPGSSDRNLLALLQSTRGRDTEIAAAPFPSIVRAATAHEELRATAIGEAAAEVLERLSAAGVEPLLCGGIALAWGIYPDPSLRHCHNVDLLVGVDGFEQARAVLSELESLSGPGPASRFVHPSGTRVALHTGLYGEPWRTSPTGLERNAVPVAVAGMPVRMVSEADLLVQLSTIRGGLCTVADAYLVAARGALDWARASEGAVLARNAGPLYRLLGLLRTGLGLAVPEGTCSTLGRAWQREQVRELLVRGPRFVRSQAGRARSARRRRGPCR